MYFQQVLPTLQAQPIFESSLLVSSDATAKQVQRQLSDWVRDGKLIQLRRGLYTLAKPYQTTRPHSYAIANSLVRGSYVSLQMALAHFSLIPEFVAVTTSVTTGRPQYIDSALGHFSYQHIQPALFFGCTYYHASPHDYVYLATPEKALLDLIYLTPNAQSFTYLEALRLQNLDQIDSARLTHFVQKIGKPKLKAALPHILTLIAKEADMYDPL